MGQFISDDPTDGDNNWSKGRLQVNNTDNPGTQTTAADEQEDTQDDEDENPLQYQAVTSLAGGTSHTIDLDGSAENDGEEAEDRQIFAALVLKL